METTERILEFPKLGISFELEKVAFRIGGMEIYFYGLIIAFGVLLAMVYVMKNSKKFGIDGDGVLDVTIGGFIGGVIGARLYYVIFKWDIFSGDLVSVFNIRDGGLAIYGGIIGAFLIGMIMCKFRKVKMLPMFDLAAFGFLIGQSIGRWGNFFNMEAFGSNTELPWGMTSYDIRNYLIQNRRTIEQLGTTVDIDTPVHPCFLYESLWCLIGFIILHFVSKKRRFDGQIFLMYMGWYGLGRVFIEGLRTDSLLIGNIRISQLVAGLIVIASIAALIVIFSKIRKEEPDYLKLYVDTDESKEHLGKCSALRKASKKKGTGLLEDANDIENAVNADEDNSIIKNESEEAANDYFEHDTDEK